jgi:trypsin
MNRGRGFGSLVACGLLAACAGGAEDGAPLGEVEQAIVRGTDTEAFPQVVMLHVRRETSITRCTGSYIAPRVVLTAAHCVQSRPIPYASYVYFGDSPAPASSDFPAIPAPGEPSDFALIESFRTHPDYDPGVNYPDLAVVYLDRDLPFAPLPLFTERVNRRFVGDRATIAGWGGLRALVPDISQVEGAGTKRQGKVTILGSPTEADFHEDDPNPGMLDPVIRADSLKTDGRAPNANGCAGDSGGPLLIKQGHKTYVAGVGYWTGLSCEDYSIFLRIDPFLGFIKEAIKDATRAPIHPRLECVDRGDDGTYQAFFGYASDNGSTVEVPHGRKNFFPADGDDVRPELFNPGDHPYLFSLDFTRHERLAWKLSPPAGPSSLVLADKRSPTCEFSAACDAQVAAECYDGTFTRADCIGGAAELGSFFPGCQPEIEAYWQCIAALPPAEENWICEPGGFPQPVGCDDPFFVALACGGYL